MRLQLAITRATGLALRRDAAFAANSLQAEFDSALAQCPVEVRVFVRVMWQIIQLRGTVTRHR